MKEPKKTLYKATGYLEFKFGIDTDAISGAYECRPLNRIERVMHELAHWQMLGEPLHTLDDEDTLVFTVANRLDRLTSTVRDTMEVETAATVYLAGKALGLWDDPEAIMEDMRGNLDGVLSNKEANALFNRVVTVSSICLRSVHLQAESLVNYLRLQTELHGHKSARQSEREIGR